MTPFALWYLIVRHFRVTMAIIYRTSGKVWRGRERVKVATISRQCAPNSGGFLIIEGV